MPKKKIHEIFVSPVLMWLIVIIGIFFIIKFIPNNRLFDIGFLGPVIFLITLLYWLYYFFGAVYVHRKAAHSVRYINKLIKTGAYSRVRHPIYSADIVLAFGIFLYFPSLNILISIIWLTLVLAFWMFLEEKSLTKKFGKEYKEYKKKVPMMFPYKKRSRK